MWTAHKQPQVRYLSQNERDDISGFPVAGMMHVRQSAHGESQFGRVEDVVDPLVSPPPLPHCEVRKILVQKWYPGNSERESLPTRCEEVHRELRGVS